MTSELHAVLFARDLESLATFYGHVLDAGVARRDAGVIELDVGSGRLILHAMPPHLVDATQGGQPPARRTNVAIKLSFGVASIARARELAATLGGSFDAIEREFTYAGRRYVDGTDPEGNVIQVHESAQ